jgi:acetyl esterase/lipase
MQRALVAVAVFLLAGCADLQLFFANAASDREPCTAKGGQAYGSEPRQKLDIYSPFKPARSRNRRPNCAADGSVPVVVFFHGGGWTSDSKDEYRFVGATLAAKGWLAVVPSYRVYPKVRFPVFVDDAAQAVAWVEAHAAEYGGDPTRIFVMGHSSGAHLALLVALDKSYLAAYGASANDIAGVIGLSGPYDFLPFANAKLRHVFAGAADPLVTQPIHFVRADAPPVLLLHGSADTVVAPQNSVNLATAIARAGGRVTLRIYDLRDHADLVAAFSELKEDPAPVLRDLEAFVGKTPGVSERDRSR